MTENHPRHPEVDDLGLTSLDWEDLRIAYLYGLIRTRSRDGRRGSVPPDGLRPQRSRTHRRP